jgi:hypothetical protein
MKQRHGLLIGSVLATVATSTIAGAQPVPRLPAGIPPGPAPAPTPTPPPPTPPVTGTVDPYGADAPTPDPTPNNRPHDRLIDHDDTAIPAPVKPATPPRAPDPRIDMPQLLSTPTGWLLPAAVLYSKTGLDTGGGFSSDSRVGLGDVAEFGVATTDQVRAKNATADHANQLQPYVTASFRMGVAEDRLFAGQPGMTLGFRKSFEQTNDNVKTRIAELTLVASKKLGDRVAVHLGGAFWDASMLVPGVPDAYNLHDGKLGGQIRPFGGFQARPLDKSEIMVELGWAPEFCYTCTPIDQQIRLRPQLAWGVRYQVADWMQIESGVRVPDIGKANLLEAQIFGQVTFTTWALRHAVDDLK